MRRGPGYPKICGTYWGYCEKNGKSKRHVCKQSVSAPGAKHEHACKYCGATR